MSKFNVGCVITCGPGREENLRRTLELAVQTSAVQIVVVFDGPEAGFSLDGFDVDVITLAEKHRPGLEQPRNVGARHLDHYADHVWFLDSDLVFDADIVDVYEEAFDQSEVDRVLIGPYDWIARGAGTDRTRLEMQDPRWASFHEHPPDHVLLGDLGAALANFGGNLIWPLDQFQRLGGFHPSLHHGRCEDGELGLRAAFHGTPMSFVAQAHAWHVWHPSNHQWKLDANKRDVPLLNAMHPWVQAQGLIPVNKDGVRFDYVCPECGVQVNSLSYWEHHATHA